MENLTPKQEIALAALIRGETKKKTAALCEVDESTIYRWMSDEYFKERLQLLQKAIFDEAMGNLNGLTYKAIQCLERNLDCGNAQTEVRSALGVIAQAMKLREIDIKDRLEQIENLIVEEKHNA